jgi:hypothetical protein
MYLGILRLACLLTFGAMPALAVSLSGQRPLESRHGYAHVLVRRDAERALLLDGRLRCTLLARLPLLQHFHNQSKTEYFFSNIFREYNRSRSAGVGHRQSHSSCCPVCKQDGVTLDRSACGQGATWMTLFIGNHADYVPWLGLDVEARS